jgi:hypothetical protein
MPHHERMIELTLQVTTSDELAATKVFEQLSRIALGLQLEDDDVLVNLSPATWLQHCHHPEHDEDEVES